MSVDMKPNMQLLLKQNFVLYHTKKKSNACHTFQLTISLVQFSMMYDTYNIKISDQLSYNDDRYVIVNALEKNYVEITGSLL